MSNLYEHLKKNLNICKLTSRQDEIMIRCPFCLDSIKDPFKTHMYIENNAPYRYYCQRCNTSGRINKKFLDMLDINNYSLIKEIENADNEYKKKLKIKYGTDLNFLSKNIIFPNYTSSDKIKNEYIENRLGINILPEDIIKYRIVYNLTEFLNVNKINLISKNKNNISFIKNINTIDRNCVGFLSHDKSTIIFRSLDKNKTGYRYNNFTIFPELDSKKTYMLSNNIDLSNKVFNIVMTEGIFDIIGVYNHIYNKQDNSNTIFMANAGKSYVVSSSLLKKLSILNADINIYSDGDVDVSFYRELMKKEIYYRLNGINLYYNNLGKDYGVTKKEIQLKNVIRL